MTNNIRSTSLWTAIVTPFTEKGEIDWAGFERLLRLQAEAGNGVVILGSTGEGLALSLEEKKKIVQKSLSYGLKTPVIAGVGGFDLNSVKEWLSFCEGTELDGYLMVCPLYAKPGAKGQTAWFRALLDSVKKPCMLYNVPSRTGVKLAPSVLSDLAGHPNLWALKEASGSLDDFQAFQKSNGQVNIFSGEDSLMPFLASLGAKGLVSVAGNVWPRETAAYVKASLKGEHSTLFPTWSEASQSLFTAANPIPAKVLLKELNLIESPTVRAPLALEDFNSLSALQSANTNIRKWWEEHGVKYV